MKSRLVVVVYADQFPFEQLDIKFHEFLINPYRADTGIQLKDDMHTIMTYLYRLSSSAFFKCTSIRFVKIIRTIIKNET